MKLKPLKVSELNAYIRKILYSNPILSNVIVTGDVRDYRESKNGFKFFSLADEDSIINCVSFHKSLALKEGTRIVLKGKVEAYDKRSTYQIIVSEVVEEAKSEESLFLSELKKKLEKMGYFDMEHKKTIPECPKRIGVITSLEGAAVEDIKRVFRECSVGLDVFFYNSFVQGRSAVFNIVSGIKHFNSRKKCDVIIIARGGGSKVDLDTFNDEIIGASIYKSETPIVTGIGHGSDMTIADLIADKETQTPTAAAEYVMRKYKLMVHNLPYMLENLNSRACDYIDRRKYYVNSLGQRLDFIDGRRIFDRKYDIIKMKKGDISRCFTKYISDKNSILNEMHIKLRENNMAEIFNKGFVLLKDSDNKIVRNISDIKKDDIVVIENLNEFAKAKILDSGVKDNE
ncbi:Exodeoxyribonuclease VII large subunit [Dethiosulfatibacter aminovorans DSM 17477]|uniref:Exodeoxyribonuclease 7 large subunit n=1 Tax=Dethiosulfatibacter aminovorans DSM 17477 TaxID=1121476 RepID=A0A1M6D967_9FIRM|nr:exodeoxyribonuclease VII large subunit [Dethiosulfatibacter aminovorans]SHI69709.1 Exodeoxyribonuclease VII large subunit [Dethiosulfatibacter aminovorans DSM 17477]